MSKGYRFQKDLAADIREHPPSLDRTFSELQRAGLTSIGPWPVEYFSRALFALAAHRPIKTVATVKALELLPFSEAQPEKPAPAQSLGLALCRIIEGVARPLILGQGLSPDHEALIASWGMDLCPELLEAQISWNTNVRRLSFIYSHPGPKQEPGLFRVTHLSGAVLLTAARHLADTVINENAAAAVRFLDRTKSGKGPVQEGQNAGTFGGRLPAFLVFQPEDQTQEQIDRAKGALADAPMVSLSRDAGKDELSLGCVKTK